MSQQSIKIRFAEIADAAAIQAIYAPNVEQAAISFEERPPTVAEMAERIAKISLQYPWLVCEFDGELAGYVYACQHRERAAYRWTVDVTVYVTPRHHRQGIGRALYTSLIALLQAQGYAQAFAGITLPNPGSIGVHESVGFRQAAVFRRVGYKFGTWRDVGWWQLALQDAAYRPAEPTAIAALRDGNVAAEAIAAGLARLRTR